MNGIGQCLAGIVNVSLATGDISWWLYIIPCEWGQETPPRHPVNDQLSYTWLCEYTCTHVYTRTGLYLGSYIYIYIYISFVTSGNINAKCILGTNRLCPLSHSFSQFSPPKCNESTTWNGVKARRSEWWSNLGWDYWSEILNGDFPPVYDGQ